MPRKKHEHEAHRTIQECACGAHRIINGIGEYASTGEWVRGKDGPDPLGQALVARWLENSTPEERSEKAARAAATRWGGKKGEVEKRHFMSRIASRPRPGAKMRIEDRCPCGKYSSWLAAKRGHRCEGPKAA